MEFCLRMFCGLTVIMNSISRDHFSRLPQSWVRTTQFQSDRFILQVFGNQNNKTPELYDPELSFIWKMTQLLEFSALCFV